MITIANPQKYVAGLYERLSNKNIEVGNGEVIVTNEDEQESGSISTQKLFLRNFCRDNNIIVGNGHTRKDGIKRGWNRNTVKRILQNVTYLGWVSNGNTKKINYKSKKTMIMPKEDRIIVKNMHTTIIDEETFNIVQDMIKSRTSTRVKSYDWLLKGLVYVVKNVAKN